MEPPALAGRRREVLRWRSEAPGPGGLDVATVRDVRSARAAVVGAGLAACLVGLLGTDGGIFWVVGGVWTVRFVWGRDLGLAWGLACVAAGLRWGTVAIGDVASATRVLGPTVATGSVAMRVATAVALAAAVADEARADGARAAGLPVRAVAVIALAALVPLYLAPGPGSPVAFAWWLVAGGVLGAAAWFGSSVAARLPSWLPPGVAACAMVVVGAGRCPSC